MARQRKTTVAIVDTQPLFREGLARALARSTEFRVISQSATPCEVTCLPKGRAPAIVVMDLDIPGGGLQAVRRISRDCPAMDIVLLTTSEGSVVSRAMAAGAKGCILRTASGEELIQALRRVARGERYITSPLGAPLLARSRGRPDSNRLTRREEEILTHVAIGSTNREIARVLHVTEKTIKHCMTTIMHKLRVRNRVEAALAFHNREVAP